MKTRVVFNSSQVKTTRVRSLKERAVWKASLSLPAWMSDWMFCLTVMFFTSG